MFTLSIEALCIFYSIFMFWSSEPIYALPQRGLLYRLSWDEHFFSSSLFRIKLLKLMLEGWRSSNKVLLYLCSSGGVTSCISYIYLKLFYHCWQNNPLRLTLSEGWRSSSKFLFIFFGSSHKYFIHLFKAVLPLLTNNPLRLTL